MKNTKQIIPTSLKQTKATAEVIKLGIDIHQTKYVVVRQIDNQAPQSPQSFKPDEFLVWVQRQPHYEVIGITHQDALGAVCHYIHLNPVCAELIEYEKVGGVCRQ